MPIYNGFTEDCLVVGERENIESVRLTIPPRLYKSLQVIHGTVQTMATLHNLTELSLSFRLIGDSFAVGKNLEVQFEQGQTYSIGSADLILRSNGKFQLVLFENDHSKSAVWIIALEPENPPPVDQVRYLR